MKPKIIMSMVRGGIEKVLKELGQLEYGNKYRIETAFDNTWYLFPSSSKKEDGPACCVTLYPSNVNFPNDEYILTVMFKDHPNINNPDIEKMKKYCEEFHRVTTLPIIGNRQSTEIYYGNFARPT